MSSLLLAERDARIKAMFSAGDSIEHVMIVEGVDRLTAGALQRHVKKAGKLNGKGKSPKKPYGLTDASRWLRGYLGPRLRDLLSDGKHPVEVATMTGITQRAQGRANQNPFHYDWRLSDMERLAVALDVPLAELLIQALQPYRQGFAPREEIDEWNRILARNRIG